MKIIHLLQILFVGQIAQYNKITDIFEVNGKFVAINKLCSVTIANEHGEQTVFVN